MAFCRCKHPIPADTLTCRRQFLERSGATALTLLAGCRAFTAALCIRHHTTPRGVYEKHFEELKVLMRQPGSARVG